MKFYRRALYSTILAGTLFSLTVPSELVAMEPEESSHLKKTILAPKEDAPEQKSADPSLQTLASQAIHSGLKENNENRFTCAQNVLESFHGSILSPELLNLKQAALLSILKELFPPIRTEDTLKVHSQFLKSKLLEPCPELISAFREHFSTWRPIEISFVWEGIASYPKLQTSFKEALKEKTIIINNIDSLKEYPFFSSIQFCFLERDRLNIVQWTEAFKEIPETKKKIGFFSSDRLTPKECELIRKISNLVKLNLSSAQVTDEGIKILAKAPNIRGLNLSFTKIGDEGIKALAQAQNLKKLNLSRTGVTDLGVKALSHAPKLQKLTLFGTKVTLEAIEFLQQTFKEKGKVIKILR